ncbi:Transcription factor MEIS1 and related HOX domain proteins protein [Dioscorea alata]|uniref:Transcription factor MEIS1 and related HOX domain proteins protein n=2 Tax=Dioscorea alata TaxID=55571 RepID=A0ACB7ULE3_DIOAL|nr:Transcription factor MEIS1 and related HOX domain proteins protein [Dioscorea alata]KAH7661272.1 Transcription factor MEIS1 and related HOX domain proteins protein [Dioscorea alata]
MVSENFVKPSASGFIQHCAVAMDDHSVHSGDLSPALQFDGRNQNNFVQLDSSVTGQLYRPIDLVHNRACEYPNNSGRIRSMHLQTAEGNDYRGLCYGQDKGLSLTLGSCALSDMVNAYQYKQKGMQGNMICSSYITARDDLTDSCCPSARHMRDEYMSCADETANGDYSSNQSSNLPNSIAYYAASIQSSRYLKPMQQLLDEAVCVSNGVELESDKQSRKSFPARMSLGNAARIREWVNVHDDHLSSHEKHDVQIRINKLVNLLDELESRYEQYFHRMDNVISSFEMIAGRGAATSYIALTIQAMSRHFINLRDAIIGQIHASRHQFLAEGSLRNQPTLSQDEVMDQNTRQAKDSLHRLGMIQVRQVWRPLRGLPENSVALLRAWLFEHFLHPYPNEHEKLMLASKTGLTKNQISNWFINARVRLWKPMIEEMYREEFAEDSRDSISSST